MRHAFALGLLLLAAPAGAADFYVDPVSGSAGGDGSAARPWRTIEQVLSANLVESRRWQSLPWVNGVPLVPRNPGAPVKAGDTIWLRNGYHGQISITGYYNAATVTIAAQPGHSPRVRRVMIRSSQNWKVAGLQISPEYGTPYDTDTIVRLEPHSWEGPAYDLTLEGSTVRSLAAVAGWTADNWNALAAPGILVEADRVTLRDNQVENVERGISVGGNDCLVERNVVNRFTHDGMVGNGNRNVYQYNVIKNLIDVNDNHHDGFQSWTYGPGGVGTADLVGVVLRGNLIINYESPTQPFRGPLQGIGCFDGTYVDWVVENNVVITDHWHGISLYGARGSRIVNNTVIDPNNVSPGPPWIMVNNHKDGTPPQNCLVRNNLATDFALQPTGVASDHNLEITYAQYPSFFVAPGANDLHLRQTAAARDAGETALAPAADIEGIPRPQGSAVDVGAFEWRASSAVKFYTLPPCRLVDTRAAPGPSGAPPLEAGRARTFPAAGSCAIPASAKALAVNLTAVSPSVTGNLRVFPAGALPPLASALNFTAGRTRANNAVVSLGTGGAITAQYDMAAGTVAHLLVDVTGYFQ